MWVCLFWERVFVSECILWYSVPGACVCVLRCETCRNLAAAKPRLQRKICPSCLKWSLFWWRDDRANVLQYHHASYNLHQNLRGWGKQKREHLHNVGAWCYPAELGLSTLNTPPSSPLFLVFPLTLSLSFPLPPPSHRGRIVLPRLGRGHGWEKCRGGSKHFLPPWNAELTFTAGTMAPR